MPTLMSHFALLILLLLMSAFFSGSEAAIFSLSKIEKRRLQSGHPLIWKIVERLLESPRRTLITILIGNMAVNTLMVAIVTLISIKLFGFGGVGWTIAGFTVVLVLFGELTPKVFAVQQNVWTATITCIPLDLIARILFPIRKLIRLISDFILRILVKGKRLHPDMISEDELKALVRIGEEEGVLKDEESGMIHKLISLSDRIVREIMTPRPDLIAFDVEDSPESLAELIKQSHYSYIPVYEKSLDHLLGVIWSQEFMLDETKKVQEHIMTPFYVPETKPVDELLLELQKQQYRCAICVDEYGGTAGIVTLEDVLEEIFGEFYDEYSKEEPMIRETGVGRYMVLGKAGLHELEEKLGLHLTSETSETLGGWLLEKLGRIPKTGELFSDDANEFYVREVHRQRIKKIEIWQKP
ncbi:MAG: hypothetical protein A3G33_11525 [Omnitrophica bacterium RIFCSPLOWO2_12_FULL_44_17]|uniref:Hemolysin n=1 Tax=Candidatus Danuiimicrobium aquiferis TaxID=1801832 RepID=A0A1G1KSS0_9BACT|nr:MAG: hypothetical protein A3B72_09365 [Omnitrophica bacterium RIFCSPHIGHO2_02_FULL_45_28]OGW91218.1 MAG: hypothetical protein A3E74_02895 [Omnitrophica bacterium RIFCSPHIGHO2_12_FULL_44_12]OGW95619.1 MAG: hypothetical protein A3G33_11525 [Omnitrophica bacterium RIFCSPLOWO2_12_FULL_44_17]OGX03668.1 MAG: hypothetical protein A3J12_00970 [Omnitrophica bacterium RIFCSPLOWO2_02_FULL_44_11]